MSTKFDTMNRDSLRKACKEANIAYGKLTVEQMREALNKAHKPAKVKAEVEQAEQPKQNRRQADRRKSDLPSEQNGIKRPVSDGVCHQIWDVLDSNHKKGTLLTLKEIKGFAEQNELDEVTATVQYYRWRKYNGIQGRFV